MLHSLSSYFFGENSVVVAGTEPVAGGHRQHACYQVPHPSPASSAALQVQHAPSPSELPEIFVLQAQLEDFCVKTYVLSTSVCNTSSIMR
jgi:hypothetical protein